MTYKKEAIALIKWKEKMKEIIKMRYGKDYKLDKEKIDKCLDKIIKDNIYNPRVTLVNNYTNMISRTDVLSIIDLIENNNLIIGGSGVLYLPHSVKENPLIGFILHIMEKRKFHKKERNKYEKGTDEWFMEDLLQLIYKIVINSLYGVTGYPGFTLYNRYVAESVTNQGRQIICTAAEAFENFLADAVNFATESELYTFITNIHNEYKDKYKGKLDVSIFNQENLPYRVTKRLINKCKFDMSDESVINIENIIKDRSNEELILLLYKNNVAEFNQNQFIKDKYKFVIENLDELTKPDINSIKNDEIAQVIYDIWDFYEVFVLYNYPIFDRVRKAMYIDKKAVLYADTDSNFIGLNRMITFMKKDILNNTFNKPEREVDFICVNLITYFLGCVVDKALKTLCKYMNVSDEYAKLLSMKNEFYMEKILFIDKKKRYISNAILQEGQLLKDGEGIPEIKGFDFKKSTVKPFVTEYFTNICVNDILKAKEIDVESIFLKMLKLRTDIETSMRKGESKYFKQSNVQLLTHYKRPYSTQGVTAITLWNSLCPKYAIELPSDVDVIPIKDLTYKAPAGFTKMEENEKWEHERKLDLFSNKNIKWFSETFPEEFRRLRKEIYENPDLTVRHMSLKYIAKPKNVDLVLPEWFGVLMDTEKVVLDMIALFAPIADTLGLKCLKPSSTVTCLTNMIDL